MPGVGVSEVPGVPEVPEVPEVVWGDSPGASFGAGDPGRPNSGPTTAAHTIHMSRVNMRMRSR